MYITISAFLKPTIIFKDSDKLCCVFNFVISYLAKKKITLPQMIACFFGKYMFFLHLTTYVELYHYESIYFINLNTLIKTICKFKNRVLFKMNWQIIPKPKS